MSTHRKTWKKREHKTAKAFGAKRNIGSGSMGRDDKTSSDSTHPTLYIECKLRVKHSAVSLWDDTAKKARKEKKVPVVSLAEKGRHGSWLLIRESDLLEVAEEYRKAQEAAKAAIEPLPGQMSFLED